jgi:hypothetical protein
MSTPPGHHARALSPAAGAAAVTVLLLCGCVKVDMNLKVKPDEHIDGSIVMAVDRSLLGNQSQDALVDELRKRVFMGTPAGSRQEAYSDARYVGTRVILRGMTILDLDRATGTSGIKIAHQGGRYRLSGTIDTASLRAAASSPDSADARRIAESFDVSIGVTFPGRVVKSNGLVDGNTVRWKPKLGDRLDISAEAEDGGSGPAWPILLLGVLTLCGLGVLALAIGVRRPRG